MMDKTVDILVSGGGIAGMAAAAAFGAAGFSVLCIDPTPPITQEADPGSDLRSTAFLQPSRLVLEAAGLWDRLAPHATALTLMRIIEDDGQHQRQIVRDFDAAEISDHPFGWNLPNWLLRREFLARLAEVEGVEFRTGVATISVLARDDAVIATLSDHSHVRARLVIGADGRESGVRKAAGIGARTLRYGQKALAFAVTHPQPHNNVSTEIHRSGGPFTLVPLPDRKGQHASAVVWMDRAAEIDRRAAAPVAAFEAEMTDRACAILGPLHLASRRSVWPIISRVAHKMTAPRIALMAEAAHVVPPIGAQGLNMSLADLSALLDLAQADPQGLGGPAMLTAYARAREAEVRARVAGIDLLNRASMPGSPGLTRLRGAALGALHGAAPIRKLLMHAGLGARRDGARRDGAREGLLGAMPQPQQR